MLVTTGTFGAKQMLTIATHLALEEEASASIMMLASDTAVLSWILVQHSLDLRCYVASSLVSLPLNLLSRPLRLLPQDPSPLSLPRDCF